jgi:Kef-type K+ transport system membrane component KefB
LEIVAGIVIGPSGFGWVDPDLPIAILSVMGLAFLLFLAGLEIELDRFMGSFLQKAVVGLLLSFALGIVVSYGLGTVGMVETPLFVAIVLLATSLGLVIPLLRDAGESSTDFGQLTIAGPFPCLWGMWHALVAGRRGARSQGKGATRIRVR